MIKTYCTPEITEWLRGQIDVLRRISMEVCDTVAFHNKEAGEELRVIHLACNRATSRLIKAAEKLKKKKEEKMEGPRRRVAAARGRGRRQ